MFCMLKKKKKKNPAMFQNMTQAILLAIPNGEECKRSKTLATRA